MRKNTRPVCIGMRAKCARVREREKMTLSARHEPVTRAGIEIANAVIDSCEKHGLTILELVHILNLEMAKHLKFAIRYEREEITPPLENERI